MALARVTNRLRKAERGTNRRPNRTNSTIVSPSNSRSSTAVVRVVPTLIPSLRQRT